MTARAYIRAGSADERSEFRIEFTGQQPKKKKKVIAKDDREVHDPGVTPGSAQDIKTVFRIERVE